MFPSLISAFTLTSNTFYVSQLSFDLYLPFTHSPSFPPLRSHTVYFALSNCIFFSPSSTPFSNSILSSFSQSQFNYSSLSQTFQRIFFFLFILHLPPLVHSVTLPLRVFTSFYSFILPPLSFLHFPFFFSTPLFLSSPFHRVLHLIVLSLPPSL